MRLAALAGVVALLVGVAVFAFQPFKDGPHVRTPVEVAGAFVYHLDHGNMGKACGLIAQKMRGPGVEQCSQGLIANEGGMMSFFGLDIFDNARLVPGSQHVNADGTVSFLMRSDGFDKVKLTVARQDSGRWRIVSID